MTDTRVARLYVAAGTAAVLALTWATVATSPWRTVADRKDERLVALDERARLLQDDLAQVREIAAQAASARAGAAVAAPAGAAGTTVQPRVRIVELPPLVITRSS